MAEDKSPGGDAASPKKKTLKKSIIDHTYRDYSQTQLSDLLDNGVRIEKSSSDLFPAKLHKILNTPEYEDIIAWLPHGRAWKLKNKAAFVSFLLPRHFQHSNYQSFNRSVNGWGMKRLHQDGPDHNGYYHEMFLRGKLELTAAMSRLRDPGMRLPNKEGEPNFYDISRRYPLPPPPPPSMSDSYINVQVGDTQPQPQHNQQASFYTQHTQDGKRDKRYKASHSSPPYHHQECHPYHMHNDPRTHHMHHDPRTYHMSYSHPSAEHYYHPPHHGQYLTQPYHPGHYPGYPLEHHYEPHHGQYPTQSYHHYPTPAPNAYGYYPHDRALVRVPHPQHHPPPPPPSSSVHETSNDEVKPTALAPNNEAKQNETEQVNETKTKQNDTTLESDSEQITKTRSLSTQFVEEYLHSNQEQANEVTLDRDPVINATDVIRTTDQQPEPVQQSGDNKVEEEFNPIGH